MHTTHYIHRIHTSHTYERYSGVMPYAGSFCSIHKDKRRWMQLARDAESFAGSSACLFLFSMQTNRDIPLAPCHCVTIVPQVPGLPIRRVIYLFLIEQQNKNVNRSWSIDRRSHKVFSVPSLSKKKSLLECPSRIIVVRSWWQCSSSTCQIIVRPRGSHKNNEDPEVLP